MKKPNKRCCAFWDSDPMLCDHLMVVGRKWRIDVCGPGADYFHSIWREPSRSTRTARVEAATGFQFRGAIVSELLRLLGTHRAACTVTHTAHATVIDHGARQAAAHEIEEPTTFEEINQ